jgi:hypothetical protein
MSGKQFSAMDSISSTVSLKAISKNGDYKLATVGSSMLEMFNYNHESCANLEQYANVNTFHQGPGNREQFHIVHILAI